jgi:hypothetical protein
VDRVLLLVNWKAMQGWRCIQMTTKVEKIKVTSSVRKKKRKKKTALVICRDRKQFWTTQTQFWQWVREGIVVKTGEQPLTGIFKREHEELLVLLSNTVLNLAHPNHMREALLSRRIGIAGK